LKNIVDWNLYSIERLNRKYEDYATRNKGEDEVGRTVSNEKNVSFLQDGGHAEVGSELVLHGASRATSSGDAGIHRLADSKHDP
jgi:hypothetical protein